ncbi:MAG: prolyl oligopeptidase family serine peptidase [Gammaproteobacteria bacterium]|nr:prolyl oligopeptidase family serine peptidase [Gammaproteobacteria bacterium]
MAPTTTPSRPMSTARRFHRRERRLLPATLVAACAAALLGSAAHDASAQEGYRMPPQEIVRILDAPPPPFVNVSPGGEWIVLTGRRSMPSIEDMAQPMLRLGGRRINPATTGVFGPSTGRDPGLTTTLSVMNVADGSQRSVDAPEGGWGVPRFAPAGDRFAITRTVADGIELWAGSVSEATARRLTDERLNGVRGAPCDWMPDGDELLCTLVPSGRGPSPMAPPVPGGPVIQEAEGRTAPVRTYQDLIEDSHGEALYEYFATSQPALVDAGDGTVRTLAEPGIWNLSRSPSGAYILAERTVRPFSYLVPDSRFPKELQIWSRDGGVVAEVAALPLADRAPIGGVEEGPRGHRWMPGEDHTLMWVEALDGGDPWTEAEHRDQVMRLAAPFDGDAAELARTALRYAGLSRGEDGLTLLTESWRRSNMVRTWQIDVDGGDESRLIWERNSQDRYGDPGTPVTRRAENGESLIVQDGDWIFLTGAGASDAGDHPFLDRVNLATGESERLFQAAPGSYESVVAMLDDDGRRVLTQYETPLEPPNYFVRDTRSEDRRQLTRFENPHPELSDVTRQFVTYEREDGVQLSGTLYLPADYEEGTRLPTIVWAYPREYSNPDVAGQVRGSPSRFTRVGGASHLFFLTQGYAVFDGPTMPIIGEETPNDTYVDQLVSSAAAAVDKVVEMGVTDRGRVGVGGHSYGAFMTANLLAHSDLFQAGIARSGAYNRTLTPFGFQNERRTFWEAGDVYFAMSPFMHADDINEPMILIHGDADNNSGTFPVQSRRMFHAMKGNGGTARLVMLPHESHGYRGRESVMHALAEMVEWMDAYVKNAGVPVMDR